MYTQPTEPERTNPWVRSQNRLHHQILTKLRGEQLFIPEQDMGIRIAQKWTYPMVTTIHMALGDEQFSFRLGPRLRKWRGHPWSDVQHNHPDIIFIMLKRNQQIFNQLPDGFFFCCVDKVGGRVIP